MKHNHSFNHIYITNNSDYASLPATTFIDETYCIKHSLCGAYFLDDDEFIFFAENFKKCLKMTPELHKHTATTCMITLSVNKEQKVRLIYHLMDLSPDNILQNYNDLLDTTLSCSPHFIWAGKYLCEYQKDALSSIENTLIVPHITQSIEIVKKYFRSLVM